MTSSSVRSKVLPPDAAGISVAAAMLREGRLVAFPTETVYGLGAIAGSDAAVARLFGAKGRPRHNPLILHFADAASAAKVALFDARADALARTFWPGPLTLVLPRRPGAPVSPLATAGLATMAVRVPGHPMARSLLRAVDAAVAAPSANRSGRLSPTTAADVLAELDGLVDLVLDGGPCTVGLESTVIDLSQPGRAWLLRLGGLDRAAIERLTGPVSVTEPGEQPRSPGMLERHYAPRTPIRLNATRVDADEALLAFGPSPPNGARASRNLSSSSDLAEAGRNLYRMLRELDAVGAKRIAVMPLPGEGLGEALADRLRRAAQGAG